MKFCFRSLFTKLTYILYALKKRNEEPLICCLLQIYLISYCKAVHFLTSLGNNKQLLFAEDLPCWIVRAAGGEIMELGSVSMSCANISIC